MIISFRGDYSFLSNMYPCRIEYNGLVYQNAESAFQAQKSTDTTVQRTFCNLNGKEAKALGKRVQLRTDWNEVKLQIMYDIVKAKFMQNPDLREKLLATGNELLIECNTWNDTYWGVCNGVGSNYLGRILMIVKVRLSNV